MKKLLSTALLLLMGIMAKATITANADFQNYTLSGSDTDANLQWVVAPINGDVSNGMKLTVSPITTGQAAWVSSAFLADPNFWTPFYATITEQATGDAHAIGDDIKEMEITDVTLTQSLFYDFVHLQKLTLNYSNNVTIPNQCFGGCERLWKVGIYVNFSGNNFTLEKEPFYHCSNEMPVYSDSYAVRDAFQDGGYWFSFFYTGPRFAITEDLTNYVWTATSSTDNLQYIMGAINGNPSNGFYLTLQPANGDYAELNSSTLSDTTWWEPFFMAKTLELQGIAYTAQNNVKQLTITNVDLSISPDSLFADYIELDSVTLGYHSNWYELVIPSHCFALCSHLSKMRFNFSCPLYIGEDALNKTTAYTITTSNASVASTLEDWKTQNSAAYTVECTASHVIIDDSQASSMIWSGSDVDSNVQFELGAIGGNPSNGFYLTLSRLDSTKPATVTNDLRNDPNYWDSYFYMTATAALGQPTYAKENIKQLTVNDVNLAQDLFWDYEVMRGLYLNYTYNATIPQGCFSVCEQLDTVFVSFSGNSLSIDSWAFNTYREYVIKTADLAAKRAFKNYKDNYGAQFTILFTGQVPLSDYYLIISGLNATEQAQWRFAISETEDNAYELDLEANNLTFPANSTFYIGTLDGTIQLGASYENCMPDRGYWIQLYANGDKQFYPFLSPNYGVSKVIFHDGENEWDKNIEVKGLRCATPTVTYSNGTLQFACDTPGVSYRYNISAGNSNETSQTSVTLDNFTLEVWVTAYMPDGSLEDSESGYASIDINPAGGGSSAQGGDLNGDGVLSVGDLTMLANMIVGKGNNQQGGEQGNTNDEHEYVDLGLPSGTLWATTNIGATNPEDAGDFFAWGETTPKSEYSWGTYFDTNDGGSSFDTYSAKGLTELTTDDDAAYQIWGSDWRIPTTDQLAELINSTYTTAVFTTQNNVNGWLITSLSNNNSIFLPNTGYRTGTSLNEEGTSSGYWSRQLDSNNQGGALRLYPNSSAISMNGSTWRWCGYPIRPVKNP